MQKLIGVAIALVLASPLAVANAQTPTVDDQIAQAVEVLPEDLRAGATVVAYDQATGARKVLRQGTNFIECQPRNPDDGFTWCLQQGVGSAPRPAGEAAGREEVRQGNPGSRRGGDQGRHDQTARNGDDVLSRIRQARPHSAALGDVAARRNAAVGWRVGCEPAGCRTRGEGAALDDVAGHTWRARDDSDQPGGEELDDHRRCRRSDRAGGMPLPEDLRAGATVFTYDKATGARKCSARAATPSSVSRRTSTTGSRGATTR